MMYTQIATDARLGRFDDWGLSTVMDENIEGPVIPRATFDGLHRVAGIDATWPVGNAGLIHVYGYLLSAVATPYGLKRDRWLDGALATTLGLAPEAFLLDDADSAGETLLQRVTDAVLPPLERAAELPDSPAPPASPGSAASSDSPAEALRLDQRAADGTLFRTVVLARGDAAALLYGVHDGTRMRIITAFPIASAPGFGYLLEQPARMRYNAATATLPPRSPLS